MMHIAKQWKLPVLLFVLLALFGLGGTQPARAQTTPPQNPLTIYFFWGDGCPHCAEAEPFLEELTQKYPTVEIEAYEVWNSEPNQKIWAEMLEPFGVEPEGVPTFIIADRYWKGFSTTLGTDREIEAFVAECVATGCSTSADPDTPAVPSDQITLPIVGTVDLAAQSLAASTALISLIDGFNPCSLWVLSMLLAITLHTGSRRKVLLIGLIFLTVTAAVYGLFITGLFTLLKITSFLGWIQVLVALVALFFALVNIKDYFWYKEGLSFTIADDKKTGITARIRRLMDAGQSFWGLVGATIVMAAGVSLVEFSCTAGFPVLWTNILAAQQVTALTFAMLLVLYLVIYQLDEMVIFFTAVYTLKAGRLEEKHGRILKLVGGMLMLTLAGVMLFDPALMNNLSSSLIIFGIAFAATLLVLLLHRVVLPAFGIQIGSEGKPRKRSRRA